MVSRETIEPANERRLTVRHERYEALTTVAGGK